MEQITNIKHGAEQLNAATLLTLTMKERYLNNFNWQHSICFWGFLVDIQYLIQLTEHPTDSKVAVESHKAASILIIWGLHTNYTILSTLFEMCAIAL